MIKLPLDTVARPPSLGFDLWVVLTGAVLLLWWDHTTLDLVIVRWFGTPQGFTLRDAFLTSALLHKGGRALGWAVALVWLADVIRPMWRGPSRSERMRWLVVALLSLLLVPAIKHGSHTSCPWDLAEFGGSAHHVSHWALGVVDGGPGHCFPSGHASTAFAFMAGHFLLRRYSQAAARAWLCSVVVIGLFFGGVQIVRGAHYPSHVMWTAWICWAFAVAADRLPMLTQRQAAKTGSTLCDVS